MKNLKLTKLVKTEMTKNQQGKVKAGIAGAQGLEGIGCRDTIICRCSRKDKRERRRA